MKITTNFTNHILVKAYTTSEWDVCNFAIINVDKHLIDVFSKGLDAVQKIHADDDFQYVAYHNSFIDFYVAGDDFDLDQFLEGKSWSFVEFEEDETCEQLFEVLQNKFDLHILKVYGDNQVCWSVWEKYTNEEFYTSEIPADKIIEKSMKREMKDDVESIFINLMDRMEMNIPDNCEDIVQYIYEDILETEDPINWSEDDVVIGFRRWIESRT